MNDLSKQRNQLNIIKGIKPNSLIRFSGNRYEKSEICKVIFIEHSSSSTEIDLDFIIKVQSMEGLYKDKVFYLDDKYKFLKVNSI
jgi:hypothetical protein